jgi:hypothetical protein
MASLYDMPDMGADYDGLAKIAKPEMMPNAPLGAGGMAGMMYYQDKNRQDGYIEKAGQLAELQARMKAQQADEYSQAAPGRQADIQVNNGMAQGRLQNLPYAQEEQSNTAQAKATTSLTARRQAALDAINPYANDWAQADTPAKKRAVRQQMIDDKVKIGNKNVEDADEEQLDAIMKIARGRQENSPAQAQKMALEKQKGDNKYSQEELKGHFSIMRTMMANQIKEKALEYKKMTESMKPETMSQWEAGQRQKMDKGQMTDIEEAAFNKFIADKIAVGAGNIAAKPPVIDTRLVNQPGKPPILKDAEKPTPAPIPKQVNAAKKTKDGWEVADGYAKKDGQKKKVLGYDPEANEWFLEGNVVIGGK